VFVKFNNRKRKKGIRIIFGTSFVLLFIILVVSILFFVEYIPTKKSPEFLFRRYQENSEVPLKKCEDALVEYYTYKNVSAQDYKNNKFGLYIYAENRKFIQMASEMVNSNGGAWGYVLIPYNVKDYDTRKWRGVFSLLLEEKLIPVIQLYDGDADK